MSEDPANLLVLVGAERRPSRVRGAAFAKRVDRTYGNYKIVRGKQGRSKAKVYRLARRDAGEPWPERVVRPVPLVAPRREE